MARAPKKKAGRRAEAKRHAAGDRGRRPRAGRAERNGLLMTVGVANPPAAKPRRRRKRREYVVPLAKVTRTPELEEAIRRYELFHGAPPTRVRVFEYDDGRGEDEIDEHVSFRVGLADVVIDTVEGLDGRPVRIKPLRLGTVYSVPAGDPSNKAGRQWIHSHREGGGKPPIHAVEVRTGVLHQLGGTYQVLDWVRR